MYSTSVIEKACFSCNKRRLATLRAFASIIDIIIVAAIIYSLQSLNPEEVLLGKRLQVLEALTYRGTQVYASAGNNHPDIYNRYGAANGVRLITHTDFEGNPLNHKDLRDPLIDSFEQGKYAITQLKDGFDLNGDNIVDINNDEVSGKGKAVSIVSPFNGQALKDKLGTKEDIETLLKRGGQFISNNKAEHGDWSPQFIKQLYNHVAEHPLAREKVYALKDLYEIGLINDAALKLCLPYGQYTLHPAYKPAVVFRIDKNGNLQYNPDNSGLSNIVSTIQGSSYAAPTGIAKEFG